MEPEAPLYRSRKTPVNQMAPQVEGLFSFKRRLTFIRGNQTTVALRSSELLGG